MKRKYISIGSPIKIVEFEENEKPIGWFRFDKEFLEKLGNPQFRRQFTASEIMFINERAKEVLRE